MGSDSLNELGAWKQPGKILKTCTIISAKRKGSSVKSAYTRDVLFLKSAIPGVSSTEIRGLVKNKKSIKGLVPEKVRAYILNNHIYEN